MRVLHQRDFRNLFFGQAASTIGDRIVFVALALYVTDIGSPTDVGIVLAAATIPLVAFLLIGGTVLGAMLGFRWRPLRPMRAGS